MRRIARCEHLHHRRCILEVRSPYLRARNQFRGGPIRERSRCCRPQSGYFCIELAFAGEPLKEPGSKFIVVVPVLPQQRHVGALVAGASR